MGTIIKIIIPVSDQISSHFKELILDGITTKGELITTPLGDIKRKYFVGADIDDIMDALNTL